MFEYKKPFTHIFLKVTDFLYKTKEHTPFLFHFQAYDLDNKSKFEVYNDFVYKNLNSEKQKDMFKEIFFKTQKIYRILANFYTLNCCKKAIKYDSVYDLSLEPLYKLQSKQIFKVLHENTLYTFSVSDFNKIIQNDLLSHDRFFPQPTFPKNPYNNVPLNEYIIYNFYFHLKENDLKIPELFKAFFNSQLNIQKFLRENEMLIRSLSIKNYDKQLTKEELFEEIILLLRSFKIKDLFIHIDFPRAKIIEKTLKLVKIYWHSEFELTQRSRHYYRSAMFIELDAFLKNNKNIGRIFFKRGNNPKLAHQHFKIHNLMATEIPDFQSLSSIISFMETATLPSPEYDIYVNESQDENEESDFDVDELLENTVTEGGGVVELSQNEDEDDFFNDEEDEDIEDMSE